MQIGSNYNSQSFGMAYRLPQRDDEKRNLANYMTKMAETGHARGVLTDIHYATEALAQHKGVDVYPIFGPDSFEGVHHCEIKTPKIFEKDGKYIVATPTICVNIKSSIREAVKYAQEAERKYQQDLQAMQASVEVLNKLS